MKKIILLFLLLFSLSYPVYSEDSSSAVLESATGIVESISYEDMDSINQGEETIKQEVTIKVLNGKYKGTQRIVDNMLTSNPAYDINLSKGDKVILHLEPVNQPVISADDINFYIADIQRQNQI